MEWALVTSSDKHAQDGWRGEARRLRSQLDAIADRIGAEYETPLTWRSENMSAAQWSDLDAVTAVIEANRLRDDDGNLMPGGSAGGGIQGYLDDYPEFMVSGGWSVGGDETGFNHVLEFHASNPARGEARPLNEHSPEFLVELLCAAAAAVDADEATIRYGRLEDELADAREEAAWYIGALTLFPNGIGEAELPGSIWTYPCPAGYPDGVVLVADLERVVSDYEALVPDLLRVHDLYKARI
ncbi:hypothetical protein L0U85_03800 [Glycomyces sp. L485]|uniref:hypothetical protein n=1 Tax=Glycomyces sp. L485 TaxID=2909235 RepID=UPI001F4AEA2D|nr:hypothetical protein [Glycomyces sp. L485]MCH7229986.1 hypothetical protein [Glycomyces sp. L485]